MKSIICGIVNSARMHCLQIIKSTIAAEKKKKKKRKTQLQNIDSEIIWIQTVSMSSTKLRIYWYHSKVKLRDPSAQSALICLPKDMESCQLNS